ncbi:UPF0481 protein At3g47200-like [Prosopis cineraria]|uniref:UPF0481 protein At3g47200-like n=1 Tax=Prosopis cineraria TaxID=364024 RepID=UPI00241064F9|nr:UPF0481 protein At3g47200-like [Prosopis cineraria]
METGSFKERDRKLACDIKEKIEAISSLKSIFRVPVKLRRSDNVPEDEIYIRSSHNVPENEMYIPDLVSIGPFHHDNENLKLKEDHKLHYLYTLLSRKPNLEATLHECVMALRDIEQTARNCYEETLNLTSDEFVEIMLLDGCFIIELFLKYAFKGLRRRGDPIFTSELFFAVRKNLILLENQIPWMVLQSLFVIVPIPAQCTLTELALGFFKNMLPGERAFLREKFSQEGNHLLDLIHQCYIPTNSIVESNIAGGEPKAKDAESATKLKKQGIKFMKFTATSLLDISFSDGVFEIPPLVTKKYTKVLFANLIALEQHHSHQIQYFTSYALLMKDFIQDVKDARLFRHLRIVVRESEDEVDDNVDEEVLSLFNSLCEGVDLKRFYYAGVEGQVKEYITRRKSWRKKLECSCFT